MRDYGIDKGLVEFRDDSRRDQRGWGKGFFSFRKMFRDYLTKLNVPFYDTCCPAASEEGMMPVRYNDGTNALQFFQASDETWHNVDAGAFVADFVSLDDGTAALPAVRLGADANNGIYGVSDTVVGVAVEGAQVATFGATTMGVNGVANLAGTMFAGFRPTGAIQSLSGTGATNITSYYTAWTTTAANTSTLANGTVAGQLKKIRMIVDAGDGVLTPTTASGFTTITFNDVADEVELMWNGTAWILLYNVGATVA